METDSVILASIGSIIAYLGAQRWIFPLFGKLWCWIKGEKRDFDKKNFDGSKALVDYKKTVIETQEQQFQVLLNQITALEVELQKYANELQTLRNTILRLNSRLYDKSLLIAELQKNSCCVEGCPHRELCKNNLDKIDDFDEVKQ